ncbi:type 1 glutamine amidotransferase [Candidatus Endoriftia persephone]|uniref:Glutamine amidotransferase class-I n=3 Tax=Gammaproteobacteria TaxID=1236 RepID=G2FBV9_9GAMM|nr:type 1 glutamine amidotransferase [Candidatus Endoriftia persephone]EGV51700.1 glutamine amidotransferase class-I [endosymbiont of Riftia pachyptila (vent Ph05)]EGW55790.1 glutamine amidotransferase class-I [endosymbiont of Tevnia jerichonana (vent Tica)]USF86237.1 type 1 glutamine amidotransferase [Candidatus Endoriftia persephone]
MKPVRIFRHIACEGPGYLGEFLDQRRVPWELVCIDVDHPIPPQVEDVSGLVFLGAAVSVNDDLPWLQGELELIRTAFAAGLPMMGVCFGGQLISKALGGEVSRGEGMEIGWFPLQRANGADDLSWLDGLPQSFDTFHWHADTFSMPPGCQPLLQSRCFRNQAYSINDHIGMQFHLEMTAEMVEAWIDKYGSDLELSSACSQRSEEITVGLDEKITRLHRISDVIYGNWLARVRANGKGG